MQDLDLAALDGSGGSGGSAGSDSDSDGGGGGGGLVKQGRRGKKTGPMSAEKREAISRTMKSKGAKSEEHKR